MCLLYARLCLCCVYRPWWLHFHVTVFSGMSALDVHVIVDVVCAHVAVLLWVMCVHVCISIPAGDVSNGEAVCPRIVCGFWVLYP